MGRKRVREGERELERDRETERKGKLDVGREGTECRERKLENKEIIR